MANNYGKNTGASHDVPVSKKSIVLSRGSMLYVLIIDRFHGHLLLADAKIIIIL